MEHESEENDIPKGPGKSYNRSQRERGKLNTIAISLLGVLL